MSTFLNKRKFCKTFIDKGCGLVYIYNNTAVSFGSFEWIRIAFLFIERITFAIVLSFSCHIA